MIPGKLFTNQILFGALLGIGNSVGGFLGQFDDKKMFQILLWLIVATTLLMLIPGLDYSLFYLIYLSQVIVIGSLFSILLVFQDKRVEDTFISLSLEINFCIGVFLNMFSPILVALPVATFSIFLCGLAFIGIVAINLAGPPNTSRNRIV